MGTLAGHVSPGFAFLVMGIWHLFNHIKLHTLNPKSYTSHSWFPSQTFRYLEPIFMIISSTISIAVELFIGSDRHQILDDDWTISSKHLHNFEHSSMSSAFLIYALFAIIFDQARIKDQRLEHGLVQIIGAVAFGQQLLMFHLHSSDHMGVEGQYHWLLQIVIVISLATTLIGIWKDKSFIVSLVRSMSIASQGVWLIVMGIALWTPSLVPKGCFINLEDDQNKVVRCKDVGSLNRAKSLANLEFSCSFVGMVVFTMFFYLLLLKRFRGKNEYAALDKEDIELESQKIKLNESSAFLFANGV